MKNGGDNDKITWKELRETAQSLTGLPTGEEFVEIDKLFSRLDLTSIPDEVRFPDEEFQAEVDAAKAEKARLEER